MLVENRHWTVAGGGPPSPEICWGHCNQNVPQTKNRFMCCYPELTKAGVWTKMSVPSCSLVCSKVDVSVSALSRLCIYFHSLIRFSFLVPTADSGADSGSSNGEEKASKAEGDAGPSCSSSSSKASGDSKSRFFDDSESEGEEEEASEEEVRLRE